MSFMYVFFRAIVLLSALFYFALFSILVCVLVWSNDLSNNKFAVNQSYEYVLFIMMIAILAFIIVFFMSRYDMLRSRFLLKLDSDERPLVRKIMLLVFVVGALLMFASVGFSNLLK